MANYIITGNPSPDCKGDYSVAGTWDGKNYYVRADNAYFIRWKASFGIWIISNLMIDGWGDYAWAGQSSNIIGTYVAQTMGAEGFTVVSVFVSKVPNMMKHYRNMRTK